MSELPKAKALADGIEVWCAHERLVPVEDLKPNPRNPNTHPAKQIELLAKNIRYFGWRHPITVSKRSGTIVAGHGRLAAARALGVKLVPVDFQEFASESDELAVVVADNRLAELSSLDVNELESIINDLKVEDFDMMLTGFEDADLAALLGSSGNAAIADTPPEDEPLEPGEVTVAIGLYRFKISQEAFNAWAEGVKLSVGFDKESVLKEIRKRLAI